MKIFWTTWVENSNGGYGTPQDTFEKAQKEAERLAQLLANIGRRVRVMQYLGSVVCKNTVWEPAETDELPF